MRLPLLRLLPGLALGLLVSGCSTIEFYWQGIAGQLDVLSRARPVSDVLAGTTDPALRTRLQKMQTIFPAQWDPKLGIHVT